MIPTHAHRSLGELGIGRGDVVVTLQETLHDPQRRVVFEVCCVAGRLWKLIAPQHAVFVHTTQAARALAKLHVVDPEVEDVLLVSIAC